MSAAVSPELPPNPDKQRIAEEIRGAQALQFLKHNQALFDDALQRQVLSAQEARTRGLRFTDIYTQETSVKVPKDRALSILLTPDGDWLRPSEPRPHFYIYFSAVEDIIEAETEGARDGVINWVEKVDVEGNRTMHTLTKDGIEATVTDLEEGIALLRDGYDPTKLSPTATRALLDEVRSFRLAPQEHAAVA